MSLLKTSNSSIMINGILGNKIQSKCGLRQGDSLSPLLFNLAINVFATIIKKAVGNGSLGCVENKISHYRLSVLQFVDDVLLFTSHLPNHVITLKFILYSFELLSSLSFSFK